MPKLYLLRHSKTQADSVTGRDYDRALKKIGREDAHAAGQWLAEHCDAAPKLVSSTALRATQTAKIVAADLGLADADIAWDEGIYGAMPGDLLEVIGRHPCEELVLVGHNPGFEWLARQLVTGDEPLLQFGLPTSGIAAVMTASLPWEPGCGELAHFYEGHRRHR